MLRSFSETVALVITAAVVIGLTLTMFLYSYTNVQLSSIGGEYSYSRSILASVSTQIGDILRGDVLERRYPGQKAIFGYREMACSLVVRGVFTNGSIHDPPPIKNYAVSLGTMFPFTTAGRPSGLDSYVLVRNASSLLKISDYYENGWTYTDLIPAGILVADYTVNASGRVRNKTLVEVIVFLPEHYSGSILRVYLARRVSIEGLVELVLYDTCSQELLLNKTGNIDVILHYVRVTT
ncbi:MAG: hypothetical protein QXL31_03285 [Thermosphaera sp.]